MKKLLWIAFIFLLAGCAKQQNAQQEAKTDRAAGTEVADFEKLLNELPITDEKSVEKAMSFFHEHFSKDNKQAGDAAYVAFSKFHIRVQDTVATQVMGDEDFQTLLYDEKEQKPAGQARAKELARYGFRPQATEGVVYLEQDPDFLAQNFNDYVSPAMQEYMEQFKKEQDQLWTGDNGILIPINELGNRAVFWEKFSKKHPDFILAENARGNHEGYLYYLLIGMNNTPAFDSESNYLTDPFKEAYQYVRNTYPDTETGEVVAQYYQLLLSTGFKRTKQSDALANKYGFEE